MNAAQNPLEFCPYWVGDILTTMSEIQPAQRWPGTTWEQITDCMLRAADKTHPAGSTGGAWEVVQTLEQMPKHNHAFATYQYGYPQNVDGADTFITPIGRRLVWWNRKRIQRRKPAHAHREQVHGCVYVPSNRLTPKGVAV